MAPKWSNRNLPGALRFITGVVNHRLRIFDDANCCQSFTEVCASLKESWPFRLIAWVLMPDHIHLIANPKDGRIRDLTAALKSLSARSLIDGSTRFSFLREMPDTDGSTHQVWQESFKALPLWSEWLIWQKINYIHNNPLKSGLVKSARDYRWSSFRSFFFDESDPIKVDKEWWWRVMFGSWQKRKRGPARRRHRSSRSIPRSNGDRAVRVNPASRGRE